MELKNVGKVVSRAWELSQDKLLELRSQAHLLMPGVLGMPIRGPLVQFYRNDETFETHVSLVNYMSYFSPDESVTQNYSLTTYDPNGRRLGSENLPLLQGQALQENLASIMGGRVAEYGVFSVNTTYSPRYRGGIRFLGETSPQFMTLYIPKDQRSGPQMVHSHKRFEAWPVPTGASSRPSGCVEDLNQVSRLDIFVLNSGPAGVSGRILFGSIDSKDTLLTLPFEIRGHGVSRLTLSEKELKRFPGPASIRIEHNRLIQHRKPILFRTSKTGFVSCNHL